MKNKALSGQGLLIRDFLAAVEANPHYKAFKVGDNLCIHRGHMIDKKFSPMGTSVFTIKGGASANFQHALLSRGERAKIARTMRDLVPELSASVG